MPILIWAGIASLAGLFVGSQINNATEQPAVVIGNGTQGGGGMPTAIKIGLYVAAGVAAVYVGKRIIAKL